jgi:isoleucyl-tRNA synthetase
MSEPAGDYKDTVNLPKTEFPMKGNLPQLEPKLLAWWEEQRIYEKILAKNASAPSFVFHDGPPYANGHLHAGHALNKILKDVVVKYRNLSGRLCDYIPGWDCHGLPIEQAVEKRLKDQKIDKRSLTPDQFLEKCREYALEFIDIQRQEFKRMGVMGRWEAPYATLTFDYEAQEIRELATFARRGSLYRRKKPVYWCLTDQTALAEAEVEYENHSSPSVYVAFELVGDASRLSPKLAGRRVALAIWTTTPWTLPANLAIAVHPKLEYVFYDVGERVLVVAKDLLPRVLAELGGEHVGVRQVTVAGEAVQTAALVAPERILAYASGAQLEGLKYRHPFYDRQSPVILGEHVTLEQGTGLVHTAPGYGQEDYEVGLKYGLDIYSPIRDDGRFDDTVGPLLAGKKLFDANPVVVDLLVEKGALLNAKGEKLEHSYPHCWRCHNPVVFRATHQWFISMEKNGLREKALSEINRVQWVPPWGRDRIRGMLENRPDWCISRQRRWGVPIPMALCESCGEAVVSAEMMEKVAQAVEREGAGVWYRTPVEQFLPAGTPCAACGKSAFRRETDILDVWFDSACSFAAVTEKRLKGSADLYLEGSDQHRGWFHSSLLVGVGTRDKAPYASCLTHGFVMDGEGKKMSKSLGNTLSPEVIIKQYGAEILRLWVASSDYRDDVRLSDQILKGLAEGYRKIRNTLRYALSNLYDFDPAKDLVAPADLLPLDQWARAQMADLVGRVRKAYEAYELHLVYHHVVDFCAMQLSATYFDILKDRLYTSKTTGRPRRSAQTVLHGVATDLLRLLAPVMSFTAEEAWQLLPGKTDGSVFLAGFPADAVAADVRLLDRYTQLFALRSEVQKHLEAARRDKVIGSSVEAQVVLSADGQARELIAANLAELPTLFITSQVKLEPSGPKSQALTIGAGFPPGAVRAEVRRADGNKCPRCWTYSEAVGQGGPLCLKCREALS